MMMLPNARLGISRPLGHWFDAAHRNGIEMLVLGDMVTMHCWKDGVKFYTIEMPAERAEQMAELLHQGAQHIKRAGGSIPLPTRVKPTVLHR